MGYIANLVQSIIRKILCKAIKIKDLRLTVSQAQIHQCLISGKQGQGLSLFHRQPDLTFVISRLLISVKIHLNIWGICILIT